MSYINIPVSESALPFALEQYYSELNLIIGERAGQPLLLNNTITTFDINEEAPFYTQGVFRLFADRKFNVSPVDLGTAIQADRFSRSYEDIIGIASTQIDATLDADIAQKIQNYSKEIRRVMKDVVQYEISVNEDWTKIADSENLKPNDPRYTLRQLNFLESIFYADVKKEFETEIQSYRIAINKLRSSAYSPAQQKLIRSYNELAETYKIARPWETNFEKTVPGVNVLTFADPKVRIQSLCDVSPKTFPASVDLVKFKLGKDNIRNITVEENTVHNELHTRTWGAGGGGSFSAFGISVGGGGSSSGSSSYKKDFSSLKSFEMGFSDIAEVYVDRGLWFDPSLFSNTELKPIFDSIPGARDLKYVSVSLIIARGLTLKVNFNEKLDTEQWSKKTFAARGGVSVFGFRFGGRGSSTTYDYDFSQSVDKKTVTFKDDPQHCRLIAVRLEKIYHPINDVSNIFNKLNDLEQDDLQKLIAGEISYADYQSLRINSSENK